MHCFCGASMGEFTSCPECGDTNHDENWSNVRTFDCGFQGQLDRRVTRCKRAKKVKQVVELVVDDRASRYRLALLDASQALDGIASDMQSSSVDNEHTTRCRELAQQMRTLAGHDTPFGERSKPSSGAKFVAFFKRSRR